MVSSQFNSLSALGVYYFKFSYSGGWVSIFLHLGEDVNVFFISKKKKFLTGGFFFPNK